MPPRKKQKLEEFVLDKTILFKFFKGTQLYSVQTKDDWIALAGANGLLLAKENDNQFLKLYYRTKSENDIYDEYYVCRFFPFANFVAVAGVQQNIQLIDIEKKQHFTLRGHGGPVHSICFHPSNHNLLFSSSDDRSIRIWDMRTCKPVCLLTGENGHRAGVLCIDVDESGKSLCSGGIDNSVKIWYLNT